MILENAPVTPSIDRDDCLELAALLEYPGLDYADRATAAAHRAHAREVRARLYAFASEVAALAPELVEEAHVRTFLVAPSCPPYASVHLFGEDSFKRAHLMTSLVQRFRELGFPPGDELPDHIAVLLRFAARLEGDELRDLARWCLALPAERMRATLANTANPYRHLLAAVAVAVAPDGVPAQVAAAIERTRSAPDESACGGCSVVHGADRAPAQEVIAQ